VKTLIIYDSAYGNTGKIARAIGGALRGEVSIVRAGAADPAALSALDQLIVGAPTSGGRPMPPVQKLLERIPKGALQNVGVAAFDTRMGGKSQGFGMRILTKTLGFAAGRIADSLKDKGGRLLAPPEGFTVKEKEGPLQEGEIERAAAWARGIVKL